MRKIVLSILAAAATVALVNITTGPRFGFPQAFARSDNTEVYRQLNLLGEVFERIRSDYVVKPSDEKLVEDAITGMLEKLDPHSSYMNPKAFIEMQQQTHGEFGGLGIEITMEDGLVKVVSPIDDTPAAKAGILAGDLITQIDDDQVQGLTLQQAVDKMRGAADSVVRLKIVRKGKDAPLNMSLIRAVVKVRSVQGRIEGETGQVADVAYVRIASFSEQATIGLKKEIVRLSKKIGRDLKGYIIDLRNNPGGLLSEAVTVSNAFLERGEIVSTRGRTTEETTRRSANPHDFVKEAKGKPVIVLINGGSASASEIVAGALQDHKRATIVGTRSFGKGSVQTIIPLGNGNGALRLTTARYYTPSGSTIQAKGITPDIEVLQDVPDDVKGTTDSKGEASLKGHLTVENSKEESGSQSYVPPNPADDKALHMAISLIHGSSVNAAFPPKSNAPK